MASLPHQLWRVEWSIARLHDAPNDRRNRTRIFTSAHAAATQVRAISIWIPSHAELLSVCRTCGAHRTGDLKWEVIDAETGLPELLPHVEARYAALEAVAHGDEVPVTVAVMIDDDEPADEGNARD